VTAKAKPDLPVKRFSSPAKWEAWLAKQHAKSDGIWLEFAKKGTGVASVTYVEALETALRYGWIDGQTASVDATFYRQRFTPRRSRSKWSKRNCAAVERLLAEGRLEPAGLREMEAAKADGRWAGAYDSPRNMRVPEDLAAELRARPAARRFFEQLDSQNRYAVLYRLFDAKKPVTRQRRLEQFVRMLEAGEKIH
jgi:uncharacterized protein YdeI (YjbR/CyaY-like superfamily)